MDAVVGICVLQCGVRGAGCLTLVAYMHESRFVRQAVRGRAMVVRVEPAGEKDDDG
jgi:hypothetical protein